MDYGKVLSRAWEITWRWKVLWILGFLASLGSGWNPGANPSYTTDRTDWNRYGVQVPGEFWAIVAAIACLAVLIGIALWVISVISRGGLIAGVQQVEDEGSTRFGRAWRVGVKRFWTLFGISVLTALPTLILVFLGIAVFILLIIGTVGAFDRAAEAAGAVGIVASILCGGTLCCGAILLAIVLEQIRVYAERAAILEGMGWIDAFKRGWQVIKENLGPTIVLWLIFFVIGLILGAIVAGGMLAILAPFAAAFSRTQPGPWILVPICVGGLLGVIVFALIASIVQTFTSATWTLAYREFTGLAAKPAAEPAPQV
jgi:hypothetical protein